MTTLPEVLPGTIISTFLPRWAGRNLSQRQKAPSVTHTCIHTHTSLPRSLVIKEFRSDANLFINTDNDRLYRGRFERVGSVPPAVRQLFGIMIFPFSSFHFFLPIPTPYEYFFFFFNTTVVNLFHYYFPSFCSSSLSLSSSSLSLNQHHPTQVSKRGPG